MNTTRLITLLSQPGGRPMSLELLPMLASAALLGLLGGGHCIGMCGGLMGALNLGLAPRSPRHRLLLLLASQLGRVLSYALAGLLIGLLGMAAAHSQAQALSGMRTLAALLLIAMGLYLADWWRGLVHLERLGQGLWRRLQPLVRRLLPVRSAWAALALGAVWGWLPCGLVYSSLMWAASQGDALTSAGLMMAFGVGTWPALLMAALAGHGALAWLRRRKVRVGAGIWVIAFGVWSLPWWHGAGHALAH